MKDFLLFVLDCFLYIPDMAFGARHPETSAEYRNMILGLMGAILFSIVFFTLWNKDFLPGSWRWYWRMLVYVLIAFFSVLLCFAFIYITVSPPQ